jgi:signal transduction histidine kinase
VTQSTPESDSSPSPANLDNTKNYPEFLGTLAHELRNALAPIRISMHVVKLSTPPNPNLDDSFAIIERQIRSFIGLIDDIQDVSRLSRHVVALQKNRIALANVVDAALATCQAQLQAAEQQVTLELPPTSVVVEADYDRLHACFVKLLQNAAKYSLPGGQVTIHCHHDSENARVHIMDTGIGIDPAMLGRVFDMFQQLNDPQALQRGGLGLGLTLARDIIHLHGGRIEARSEGPGRGSEFIVTLPLAKAE